jgi:hypothetical protein
LAGSAAAARVEGGSVDAAVFGAAAAAAAAVAADGFVEVEASVVVAVSVSVARDVESSPAVTATCVGSSCCPFSLTSAALFTLSKAASKCETAGLGWKAEDARAARAS